MLLLPSHVSPVLSNFSVPVLLQTHRESFEKSGDRVFNANLPTTCPSPQTSHLDYLVNDNVVKRTKVTASYEEIKSNLISKSILLPSASNSNILLCA